MGSNLLVSILIASLTTLYYGRFKIFNYNWAIGWIRTSEQSTSVVLKSLLFNSVSIGIGIMSDPPLVSVIGAPLVIFKWASSTKLDNNLVFDYYSYHTFLYIYSAVVGYVITNPATIACNIYRFSFGADYNHIIAYPLCTTT